jgi:hypothetical protein
MKNLKNLRKAPGERDSNPVSVMNNAGQPRRHYCFTHLAGKCSMGGRVSILSSLGKVKIQDPAPAPPAR